MRRYIYHDHVMCTQPRRREIRESTNRDMNERPDLIMTEMRMSVIPTMRAPDTSERYLDTSRFEVHSMVFETLCFTTAKWVEEHVDHATMTSCGHYNMYHSYFQVPQNVELPQTELLTDGHTYHDEHTEPYRGLDGEAYYRYRMIELQRRLDDLERDRIILPREEIRSIHDDVSRHFDNELFRVE